VELFKAGRAEGKLSGVPPDPHVGFLLKHHNRALKITREALHQSTAPADVEFVQKLDRLRFEQIKRLAIVYADDVPERLAQIEAVKTLTDIRRVFIELVDESTPVTQS
jgi:hypothetical protein